MAKVMSTLRANIHELMYRLVDTVSSDTLTQSNAAPSGLLFTRLMGLHIVNANFHCNINLTLRYFDSTLSIYEAVAAFFPRHYCAISDDLQIEYKLCCAMPYKVDGALSSTMPSINFSYVRFNFSNRRCQESLLAVSDDLPFDFTTAKGKTPRRCEREPSHGTARSVQLYSVDN